MRDITERKRAEQKIQLLMGEVNHRSKNLLGVVQSIAKLTAPNAEKVMGTRMSQDAEVRKARILVVEDDALLAIDLAQWLETAGFQVVGPAATVEKALKLIRQVGCYGAVLDVHLGKETSEAIAIDLRARGKPLLVVTGYSHQQLPPALAGAPRLSKPFQPISFIAELRHCLA